MKQKKNNILYAQFTSKEIFWRHEERLIYHLDW